MRKITVQLPYPNCASVNSVWKRGRKGMYLNPKTLAYRKAVYAAVYNIESFNDESLYFDIKMYPPDKRIRDIDNILKPIFDSLQCAQIINSDYQIRKLRIERFDPIKDGLIELTIESIV